MKFLRKEITWNTAMKWICLDMENIYKYSMRNKACEMSYILDHMAGKKILYNDRCEITTTLYQEWTLWVFHMQDNWSNTNAVVFKL